MRARLWQTSALLLLAAAPLGCVKVQLEPVKIEPIHATLDIRIQRVDQKLNDFFAFEDDTTAPANTSGTAPGAAPANPPAAPGAKPGA